MSIYEALEYLKKQANATADLTMQNSLSALYRVILRASTPDAAKWAKSIEQTVAYVEAGHHPGTDQEVKRILSRRVRRTIS